MGNGPVFPANSPALDHRQSTARAHSPRRIGFKLKSSLAAQIVPSLSREARPELLAQVLFRCLFAALFVTGGNSDGELQLRKQ